MMRWNPAAHATWLAWCLFLPFAFSPAASLHAKSLQAGAKWFGPEGRAMVVHAQVAGREMDLAEAAAYLDSPAYARRLQRALPLIAAQVASDKIPCVVRDGMFRYRARDPARRLSPDQQWSPWAEDSNRNLRWAHQSLSLAGCYLRMLDGDSGPGAEADLEALLADWYRENAVANPPDPEFSWGDHTIAFRLRRTVAIYLALRKRGKLDPETARLLLRMAYSHTRILLEEEQIRMRGSNHALDQAQALFVSGMAFPFLKYADPPVRQAYRRAMYEAEFLVASDGVQTENSPAYHQWVPTKVFSLLTAMSEHLDEPLPGDFVARMIGATRFATWITRPDGTLPPIGDTGTGALSKFRAPEQVPVELRRQLDFAKSSGNKGAAPAPGLAIFGKSGYLIYRNRWSGGNPSQDVHLVFKCGFLSHGHRHDDDGNVVLYGFGTDWLTDGGMYGYEHASPERRYVTGPLAHNVSLPLGARTISRTGERRYRQNRASWGLTPVSDGNGATCHSYMYEGVDYRRRILFGEDGLRISDELDGPKAKEHRNVSLFRVPVDKSIETAKGQVEACDGGGRCLRISYDPGVIDRVVVSKGNDKHGFSFDTDGYLRTRPVQTIRLFWKPGTTESGYLLRFDGVSAFGAGIEPVRGPADESREAAAGVRLLPIGLGVGALLVLQLLVVRGRRSRWTLAWFCSGLVLGVVAIGLWIAPPRYLPSGSGSRVAVTLAQDLGEALSDPAKPHIVFLDGGSYSARGVDPARMEARLASKTGRAYRVVALALPGANQTERRVLLEDALSLLSPEQRAALHEARVTLLLEIHEQYDRYPLQQLVENPRSDRAYGYLRPSTIWHLRHKGFEQRREEDRIPLIRDVISLGAVNAVNAGIATRVDPVGKVQRASAFIGLRRADDSFRFKGLNKVIAEARKPPADIDFPVRNIADRRRHIVESFDARAARVVYFSVPSTTVDHVRYAKAFCRDQAPPGAACIDHANRWLLRRLNHRKYWFDAGHLLEQGAAQYTRWLTDRLIPQLEGQAGEAGK